MMPHTSPSAEFAEHLERHLRDKIHEIAQDLRDAADRIENECLPQIDDDPVAVPSTAIRVVTTTMYNLQLDKLPRTAADLFDMRTRAEHQHDGTDLRDKLIAAMTYDHDSVAARDCIDNIMAIVEGHDHDN